MKKIKIAAVILLVVFLAVLAVDCMLAQRDKAPVFAVPLVKYDDGGSAEYYGPGYKVIKYVELTPGEGPEVVKVDFGSWFMDFSPAEED